jgi:hypothetical protein
MERFSEEELPPLPEESQAGAMEVVKAETGRAIAKTAVELTRNKRPVPVTRQELYEKVWQVPLKRLAEGWGTSYEQLVSACQVMNVPRPPAGHWAQLSLGLPVEKLQLPEAGAGIPSEATLQPRFSRAERVAQAAEKQQAEATAAKLSEAGRVDAGEEPGNAAIPGVYRVELPPEGAALNPIAERHIQALQKGKLGELGFVSTGGRDLFRCELTSVLVPKFGRAVHALIGEMKHRGYSFEEGKDDSEVLGIVQDGNRVEVRWREVTIELEREPTNVDKRRPSWTWKLRETKATGKLAVEVIAPGLKGKRKWNEGDGRSLEEILGVVAEKIETTFRWFGEKKDRELELARRQAEAEQRRLEEAAKEAERQTKIEEERKARERVRRHQAKLEQLAELRRQNLLVAAKLWIQSRGVEAFVAYCEVSWRVASGGKLTEAQADWLAWARAEAARMGPFGKGYPVPEKDGKIDGTAIPVGGPYPEPTELERLEEAEANQPVAEREVRYVEVPRQPEQFPFWLLHRNR